MNRDIKLLRWIPHLVLGSCGALAVTPASAQTKEPAATLLPARPAPATVIVRGSTPDSILPSFTGGYVPSVPAPNYGGAKADLKGAWVGNKWAGLKETVVGKPAARDAKAPQPDPRMNLAPTNPLFGTGVPAQPIAAPSQNVYASAPAYRWYGYGGTTPGANPHSPSGVYPQGSANWYSQTGATPGAFPVSLTGPTPEMRTVEPPVYAGRVSNDPSFQVGVPSKPAEAKPVPRFLRERPNPEPRVMARTPAGPASDYNMPVVPSGTPMPIAASSDGRIVPSEPVALPTIDLNLQTSSGRGVPLPNEPELAPSPPKPTTPDRAWTLMMTPAPKPTISVIRGPLDAREPQSLEQFIRNACVGRVVKTDVRAFSATKLVVTFVVTGENAAREAAALVANLPELKPFEVTFEAQIVGR